MFGNYDYKFGGGRPKLLIAKFLEVEVLPHLPHISPTDPVGRENSERSQHSSDWLAGRHTTRAHTGRPNVT